VLQELSQLIDLHELDKELLGLSQDLAKLPEELLGVKKIMADLEAALTQRQQELEDLRRQRQELEAEVAELESGITASRQRLMEIKNNIEYKAMLKEIAFKEDQRDQKETIVLELLEKMEATAQEQAALTAQLAEQGTVLSRLQAEVDAQSAELQAAIAALEEKRQSLRQAVPPTLLKRYEFIRSRRNGSAIAEVQEGVCLGCHMNILPQQFIDLQKGEDMIQCPHCQRILYWLGEPENPQPDATSSGAV
jgi:hypothetical protein